MRLIGYRKELAMRAAPEVTRVYQNHHLDSTRWNAFTPRRDDIVIATSYKAGTTWTQAIVANLLFPEQSFPAPPWQLSPWLDLRVPPLDQVIAGLEAQENRRFIKTHLALDGLRYFPEVKYIFVSRDGRDVFMSLWNHYSNYTDAAYARFNDTPGRVGDPLPRAPGDIQTAWRNWTTRGWFDWESDGWPFWSHLFVTQSWWNYRHLENIHVVHYADMKRNLSASVKGIADFLEIDISPERLEAVVQAVSFDTMKQSGDAYVPQGGASWKQGVDTFMHRGTNGRWRDVLTADEVALYAAACERTLTDDCRTWLNR
jgi:aryl sulfotransferase